MKTFRLQPTERVKLTWWQRVIVALVFVVVTFIGSTAGRVLFGHSSVASAVCTDLQPIGLAIWFVFGLTFSPFLVRRRIKP